VGQSDANVPPRRIQGFSMSDDFDRTDAIDPAVDPMRPAAAAFLGEVLEIADAHLLADDLSAIKRDANASIYTIQLDSSVGPAAFLVYAYLLHERGGDGHSGQELFENGLATLQQAAQRSTPGPRAVAHADDGTYGFILATTPGTYRALTGEVPPATALEASPADLLPVDEAVRIRSELAQELLAALRQANQLATDWLKSIQLAEAAAAEGEHLLAFTPDETELALYLLDDDSIGNLLNALNLLVSTAQQSAAAALEED
jgi:hypothetical protein